MVSFKFPTSRNISRTISFVIILERNKSSVMKTDIPEDLCWPADGQLNTRHQTRTPEAPVDTGCHIYRRICVSLIQLSGGYSSPTGTCRYSRLSNARGWCISCLQKCLRYSRWTLSRSADIGSVREIMEYSSSADIQFRCRLAPLLLSPVVDVRIEQEGDMTESISQSASAIKQLG